MTFLIAYPATAPSRNPPPAETRKSSTGKSEDLLLLGTWGVNVLSEWEQH